MTAVIRRCPFYDVATQVEVAGEKVDIRPYQIILWVSLRTDANSSRRFPAILDTGHSLNFSIAERQLREWAGIEPGILKEIGRTTLNNRAVLLSRADLALHRNRTGHRDELAGAAAAQLQLAEGIVVHASNDPLSPRLPLLGLRALVRNRLRVLIDGRNLAVSINRGIFYGLGP